MRVVCVAGARPNFMKVKPVLDALERARLETVLVHTGQHYDPGLTDVFFEDLGLRRPDHHLEVGSGSHARQTALVMMAFEPVVEQEKPDLVVVVGDVNSTLAAALVASKLSIPLAHVEAGLRSRDWTMPEEVNRVLTDRLSDHLFAPSADAVDNLCAEGIPEGRIHLVGNVMVDTLLANLERARSRTTLDQLGVRRRGYGLVTLHRPANVDDGEVLRGLLRALGQIAHDLPLVFPVHPRTRRRLADLQVPAGVMLTDPLGYLDFIAVEDGARLALTDSGGVQEETTVLGVPCLTLRSTTERPITVSEGTNRVVSNDPERILEEARAVLQADTFRPRRPALWDGRASERIVDSLVGSGRRQEARG